MSFKFINGIEPLITPDKNDFDGAMDTLLENIRKDYEKWTNGDMTRHDELSLKPGRKFMKVIRGGWSAPAKHTRGNIFDKNQDYFRWTGPNYR